MGKSLNTTLNILDSVSIYTGKLFSWLLLPMVASLVYEVIVRYLFASPTIWAGDLTCMLCGTLSMFGAVYTLQNKMHISCDFIYRLWPKRLQALVDILLYLFLFFPSMGIFLWKGWEFALISWIQKERLITGPWMPPAYPVKMVIPIATALLLLQGVSEFVKRFYVFVRNRDL